MCALDIRDVGWWSPAIRRDLLHEAAFGRPRLRPFDERYDCSCWCDPRRCAQHGEPGERYAPDPPIEPDREPEGPEIP